jgi:hypothetical protein
MSEFTFQTTWFAASLEKHSEVTKVTVLENDYLRLERKKVPPITVAGVLSERIDLNLVEDIFESGRPTVIALVPKAAHYDWEAREFAEESGSTIHTVKELYSFMGEPDPRPFVDRNVSYIWQGLSRHSEVRSVEMICEASMRVTRRGGKSEVVAAIEFQYEFSEEAAVQALTRHPDATVILNANPNGRSTSAALAYSAHTGVPIFGFAEMMGALNYDGARFRSYKPPR